MQLVKRAERAGFKAIALTVDTPILGRREADIKNRLAYTSENFSGIKLNQRFAMVVMVNLKNLIHNENHFI